MDPSGKAYEPDDPFTLVATGYPVADEEVADREMARCFIEEYALMGWPAHRIRHLFGSQFFAGTHAILLRRGEAFVDALLAEAFGPAGDAWSPIPEQEG